ncbi:MAG TPA: exodeoxyribonuclease VII small subunit [Ktedonobacteraceae bacterium]|nr:exodeoxyribonuclease VII small subunit [Ktedonobacteraceae bacterium]
MGCPHLSLFTGWGGEGKNSRKAKKMDTLSFEQAFDQLEAAVEALQDGQMPLERALSYYEEGMKLAQRCNELLEKAELRVQQLRVTSAGMQVLEPFE